GRHRDGAANRRAGRGGRDADGRGRGVVGDRDRDRAGGRGVSDGVAGPRGQGVGAVAGPRGVPGDQVGGARVVRAEVGAVELELDAGHAVVVGGAGGHGDGAGDRRAGRGGRDADRRGCGVVEDRDGDRARGG